MATSPQTSSTTSVSTESTRESTAATTTTTATTSSTMATQTASITSTTSPSEYTNTLMYVGVGIAVAVVAIFAIVAVLLWCRCRRRRTPDSKPEMPKPYPPVMPESVMSTSTDFLVPDESLSADSLPIAPPPPQVEFEPDPQGRFHELNENTAGEDEEGGEDYLQPGSWKPASDDLYIPMDVHVKLEPPVPSSQLTVEYAGPSSHPPKPVACHGSKGYVNIPNSGARPATPVKYPKVKEEDEEEEAQEDYQNVPTASTGNGVAQNNANTLPKYANLSAEEMMRGSPRCLPKVPKTNVKAGQPKNVKKEQPTKVKTEQTTNAKTAQPAKARAEHTPKKVTPKVTPKVKHKQQSQEESEESAPDYVNVKQYSKKAEVRGRPDIAELKLALKSRKK